MREYPSINTMYKRDMSIKGAPIIVGQYTTPEFEYLANNRWIFTEKVDGTNVRVGWNAIGGHIEIGGRTDNAQIPTFLLARLYEIFDATALYKQFGEALDDTVLYGEGYGARIQKAGGNYNKDGVDFVLFDVLVGDWWLKREDMENVARNLGLRIIPVVGQGTLQQAADYCRVGVTSDWGDFIAEGLVLKPEVELKSRKGERIITKIKWRDFVHERRNDAGLSVKGTVS
jgi:ATP-dependent RNA circularization protein (DNA/RNA ligase family)